jgi:AhpD family alkylhydroperoxidase
MHPRMNPYHAGPDVMKAMMHLEKTVESSGLDPLLVELIKTRVSQINGCAFCLHMHARDARSRGELEERLYLLDAWRESSLYSELERAALGWAEALTLVAQTHAPDAVYEEARRQFDEAAMMKLTLLVTTINSWNRFAIGFRMQHPPRATKTASPQQVQGAAAT